MRDYRWGGFTAGMICLAGAIVAAGLGADMLAVAIGLPLGIVLMSGLNLYLGRTDPS